MKFWKNNFPMLFIPFLLIIFSEESVAQVGIRNSDAHIKASSGTYIEVNGGDFTNKDSAPKIDLDGVIEISGDWINSSSSEVFINRDITGKVIFNGSSQQNIKGSATTVFEAIEVNNASGLLINVNTLIEEDLQLTNGRVDLTDYVLTIGENGAINGSFSEANMIVINGTGQIRKEIAGNTTFNFPLGDNSSTIEYSPVTFSLINNAGLSSAWVGVGITDAQHPNDSSISEYISRYWAMEANGISNPEYDLTFSYSDSDIVGEETGIYGASYNNGTSTLYGPIDTINNQLVFSGLYSLADFTGIAGLQNVSASASGTWSDQIGTTYDYTNVTIPSGVTIELQSGKTTDQVNNVTIQPNGNLTVNGSLDIKGDLYLSSDNTGTGSLIDKGTLTIQGSAHLDRYLAETTTSENWRYLSVPIAGATTSVIEPGLSGSHLFWWDEVNDQYVEITSGTASLNILQGYAVASPGARTLTFKGTPNTGPYDVDVTRTTDNQYEGFNLVGNPYPSHMNWDTTTWSSANLQSTIWYRSDGNFATYNKSTHAGTNGGSPYIPPMQAFWVRVLDGNSSGNYAVSNNVRTHHNQSFYKSKSQSNQQDRDNLFRLQIEQQGSTDELLLAFMEDASNYFDTYDSEKMFAENMPQIYTISEGREVAINGMHSIETDYSIPVGIRLPKEGNYALKATNIKTFSSEVSVFLEDKLENAYVNLEQNSEYSFYSGKIDTTDRFTLHFKKSTTDISEKSGQQGIEIYSYDKLVLIRVNNETFIGNDAEIRIFNMNGQKKFSKKTSLSRDENKFYPELSTGYYVVKVINAGKVISGKIFFGDR